MFGQISKGLSRRVKKYMLNHTLKSVLDTPAVDAIQDADVVLVTQLQSSDLLAYLVAVKSVLRNFESAAVKVVSDGLSEDDKKLLSTHIRHIEFKSIDDVDTDGLPRGGCWERLVTMIKESQHRFALQVDSDIVAPGPLPLLADYVKNNTAFALANKVNTGVLTLSEVSEWILQHEGPEIGHVQKAAELNLAKLPNPDTRKYAKATAAFAGFPKGECRLDDLKQFSLEMEAMLGVKEWKAWGSEQVASNYIIANCKKAEILPYPDYVNHNPDRYPEEGKLFHFYGTYRFHGGRYREQAKRTIASLM